MVETIEKLKNIHSLISKLEVSGERNVYFIYNIFGSVNDLIKELEKEKKEITEKEGE